MFRCSIVFPIVSLLSQQDDSGDVLAPAHCQIKGYNPFIWDDDHDVHGYDKCDSDNEIIMAFIESNLKLVRCESFLVFRM